MPEAPPVMAITFPLKSLMPWSADGKLGVTEAKIAQEKARL